MSPVRTCGGSFIAAKPSVLTKTNTPVEWQTFFQNRSSYQTYKTPFFLISWSLIEPFLEMYKQRLVDFSYLYRHTAINPSFQSSKFYPHFSKTTLVKKNYTKPQITPLPVNGTVDTSYQLTLRSLTPQSTRFLKTRLLNTITGLSSSVTSRRTALDQRHQG